MNFIWSEPPKDPCGRFPQIFWEEPVMGWLHFNGVWPAKNTYERKFYSLEYNYAHHFYDIHIYEDGRPGCGPARMAIDQMITFLTNSKLKWTQYDTHQWVNSISVPGVRFWIEREL